MNTFILESNIQIDYNRAVGMETTPWSNVIPRPTDTNGISITGIAAAVAKVTGGASGGTATVSLYWLTKALGEDNIIDYDYVKANGTLIGDASITANTDDVLYNTVVYSEELADITEQCYLVATVDITDTIIIEGLVFSVQYVDQDLMAHVDDSDNPHGTKVTNLADVTVSDLANSSGQRLVVNEDGTGFTLSESSGVGIASAKYKFNSSVATGDPTDGHASINNADASLATELYISKTDMNGVDKTTGISLLAKDDFIGLADRNTTDHYNFRLTEPGVDNTTYYTFSNVIPTSTQGILNNNENIYAEVYIMGAKRFTGLLDTPNDFSSNEGKTLVVNSGEDALEFADHVSELDNLTDVDITTTPPSFGQTLAWNGGEWVPLTIPQSSAITIQDPLSDDNIPIGVIDVPVTFQKIIVYTKNCSISFNINTLFSTDQTVADDSYEVLYPDNPNINAGTLIEYIASNATITDTNIVSYVNITLVYKIG